MKALTTGALAALAIVAAAVACDSSKTKLPSAAREGVTALPSYLQEGTRIRINLATAEARARVLFKDPVQGVKDVNRKCQFHDLGQLRLKLSALIGEYDTETCAGLLYYFRNDPNDRRPKPISQDTVFLTRPVSLIFGPNDNVPAMT